MQWTHLRFQNRLGGKKKGRKAHACHGTAFDELACFVDYKICYQLHLGQNCSNVQHYSPLFMAAKGHPCSSVAHAKMKQLIASLCGCIEFAHFGAVISSVICTGAFFFSRVTQQLYLLATLDVSQQQMGAAARQLNLSH